MGKYQANPSNTLSGVTSRSEPSERIYLTDPTYTTHIVHTEDRGSISKIREHRESHWLWLFAILAPRSSTSFGAPQLHESSEIVTEIDKRDCAGQAWLIEHEYYYLIWGQAFLTPI